MDMDKISGTPVTAQPVEDHDVKGEDVHHESDMKVYGHAEHVFFTPEEGKKVLRKIDLILLPLLTGCYIFSVSSRDG